MASIHDSLKALGPVTYKDVPQDEAGRAQYLKEHLSAGKLLIESVPQPVVTVTPPANRSRAVSSASSVAEISLSTARTETPTEHEAFQKDWGKPIKLSDKDNPLGISVFKLSGKDGRGAWFARRSVHEGLSYDRWKKGLEEEFESSLHVEGGPGAGKVRGLGAEKRPESHRVPGVGTVDVWEVSAQFPGPSAPRDFVSMVMTSDRIFQGEDAPKHFMIISKPCEHEECPPKDGLVRGQYESIEFIREISQSGKTGLMMGAGSVTQPIADETREKTIAFAEPDHDINDTAEPEPNPVEWIMITRSDPGGSVPRFLVERGTPGGIVSDASKFLDWACKTDFNTETEVSAGNTIKTSNTSKDLEEPKPESKSEVKIEGKALQTETPSINPPQAVTNDTPVTNPEEPGLLSKATNTAQSILQSLTTSTPTIEPKPPSRPASISSNTSSSASFASAESDLDISNSLHSTSTKSATSGTTRNLSAQEKELLRLANRKAQLDTKLQQAREVAFRDPANPTDKETQHWTKTQAKHDSEISKAEDRYVKAVRSIEAQRQRDEDKARAAAERATRKEEEKRLKAERKAKETQERETKKADDARRKDEADTFQETIKALTKEKDVLKDSVRALRSENMMLRTLVSKLEGGERLLAELKGRNEGASAS